MLFSFLSSLICYWFCNKFLHMAFDLITWAKSWRMDDRMVFVIVVVHFIRIQFILFENFRKISHCSNSQNLNRFVIWLTQKVSEENRKSTSNVENVHGFFWDLVQIIRNVSYKMIFYSNFQLLESICSSEVWISIKGRYFLLEKNWCPAHFLF